MWFFPRFFAVYICLFFLVLELLGSGPMDWVGILAGLVIGVVVGLALSGLEWIADKCSQ